MRLFASDEARLECLFKMYAVQDVREDGRKKVTRLFGCFGKKL